MSVTGSFSAALALTLAAVLAAACVSDDPESTASDAVDTVPTDSIEAEDDASGDIADDSDGAGDLESDSPLADQPVDGPIDDISDVADHPNGDAPTPSDVLIEQPVDHPFGCGAVGHYLESSDDSNNPYAGGQVEPTGRTLGPEQVLRIGGCVSPTLQSEEAVDSDAYSFAVAEPMRLQAELRWEASSTSIHSLAILDATGLPVAWWTLSNSGRAITVPVDVAPGSYRVQATAAEPEPAAAYPYEIRLANQAEACAPLDGDADYEEADESGSGHRANDVAAVRWPGDAEIAATDEVDAVELTGMTLSLGADRLVRGQMADIGTAGDDYLDRDTFEVTTGPGVARLGVELGYPDSEVNLDILAFPADDLSGILGSGISIELGPDAAVVSVEPNTRYWLWVGAADDSELGPGAELPVDYTLTLCPRAEGGR